MGHSDCQHCYCRTVKASPTPMGGSRGPDHKVCCMCGHRRAVGPSSPFRKSPIQWVDRSTGRGVAEMSRPPLLEQHPTFLR